MHETHVYGFNPRPYEMRTVTIDDDFGLLENIQQATPTQLKDIFETSLAYLVGARERKVADQLGSVHLSIECILGILATENSSLKPQILAIVAKWDAIGETVLETYNRNASKERSHEMIGSFIQIFLLLLKMLKDEITKSKGTMASLTSGPAQIIFFNYWLLQPRTERFDGMNLFMMETFSRVKPRNGDDPMRGGTKKRVLEAIFRQIDFFVTTASRNSDEKLLEGLSACTRLFSPLSSSDGWLLAMDTKAISALVRASHLLLMRSPNSLKAGPKANTCCLLFLMRLTIAFSQDSRFIRKAIKRGFFEVLANFIPCLVRILANPVTDSVHFYNTMRDALLRDISQQLTNPNAITYVASAVSKLSPKQLCILKKSPLGDDWTAFESLLVERHATLRLCKIAERMSTCNMCKNRELRSSLLMCSACHGVLYCSKLCQVSAWRSMNHKVLCKTQKALDFSSFSRKYWDRKLNIMPQIARQDISRQFAATTTASLGSVAAFDPLVHTLVLDYMRSPTKLLISRIDELHQEREILGEHAEEVMSKIKAALSEQKETERIRPCTIIVFKNPGIRSIRVSWELACSIYPRKDTILETKTPEGKGGASESGSTTNARVENGSKMQQCHGLTQHDFLDSIIAKACGGSEAEKRTIHEYWNADVDAIVYGLLKDYGLPPFPVFDAE